MFTWWVDVSSLLANVGGRTAQDTDQDLGDLTNLLTNITGLKTCGLNDLNPMVSAVSNV